MLAMASLWIIPDALDAPGQIAAAYNGKDLQQIGVARSSRRRQGIANSAAEQKAGNSTLQIGLLDPSALTVRSMTTSVLPTVTRRVRDLHRAARVLVRLGRRPDLHRPLGANWYIRGSSAGRSAPLGALLVSSAGSRCGGSTATRSAAPTATSA